MYFDAVLSVLAGPDRDERRLDIDIRFPAPEFAVGNHAALNLDAELAISKTRHVDFTVGSEAQQIGMVKLNFGSRTGSGRDRVAVNQGSIDFGLHPVARLATPHRDVAIGEANASDPQGRSVLPLLSPTGERQG